jgi:oligosaccharyl transferase (archaeosortase A-associated)
MHPRFHCTIETMDLQAMKKYRPSLLVLALFFFMILAFVIRVLPAFVIRDPSFFPILDTDTWYNLRQIEVMVHHFPQYNWFDPMTAYPVGKMIDWGPLYPGIAASFCLVTGATTRDAIISTAGFVSPILAVLMVPVLYALGKKIGDWKTGVVAAGLITVVSFPYFTFSSYGMVDHHIAEVFFSSLFFAVYLSGLIAARENPAYLTDRKALLSLGGLAVLAGILYFLALITSTTVLIALLIIAIFTLVQGIADYFSGKPSDYLCILNLVFLTITSVLLVGFGFRQDAISFTQYSVGLVYLHLAIMAETVIICALARLCRNSRSGFSICITGLIAGSIILSLIVPSLQGILQNALSLLFGFSVYTVGVQETLPWSWSSAFDAINVAMILMAGGFLVIGYRILKRRERELVFFAVWSVLMLIITIQHQRFLYYFTVNIVLLSAICITEPFRWQNGWIMSRLELAFPAMVAPGRADPTLEVPAPVKTGKKKQSGHGAGPGKPVRPYLKDACFLAIGILTIVLIVMSISQDYHYGISAKERELPADWIDTLQWMNTQTPDPGVDYFSEYKEKPYSYPSGSYGIMAVWDAGHWITFFSHRLPITNPFQDNLGGESGAAAFFLSENESRANRIMTTDNGRYVITDSTMAVDRFTNLVPWVSGSVDISRYIKWFLIPDINDKTHLKTVHEFDDGYFQTLVVRLHNFDGSMMEPTTADYLRYEIRKPTALETAQATGYSRVITSEKTVIVARMDNSTPLIPEGPELIPMVYANLYSGDPARPVQKVPALSHYRLVHESLHNATVTPFPESEPFVVPGMKMVKVFEYVPGAHIAGTGVIELPVVTNTGRAFTYRQESSGGEFVVPYSTIGNPYDVRATGPYHIVGTTRDISVTESDILAGKQVSG